MQSAGQEGYQLLIETHLCQVLPEHLAVHVDTLLSYVEVPVHFRIHTLSSCTTLHQ